MKKLLFVLGLGILFSSCSKFEQAEPDPTTLPVQKRLKFNIYSNKDYSDTKNDGTSALITIKVNSHKMANHQTATVWDTSIAERQIKNYPLANHPIIVEKVFNNIIDKDETISCTYVITVKYNFGATAQNTEKTESFDQGNISKQLGIIL
ncbi:hypothetical protein [Solitalea lacus]|uniref:hypothetical protein n=1 Tax=Solitalea lacus TaxID=2911172 RepID=UPI001EDA0FA0|nr:hypothetical protein [Solitalea lacus]UKJ07813.1 hypothetical protein L2B55_01295 [Solitalea lacus]